MPIRFSILIPVYNVEKYLRECLDSVLNQLYTNFEMILIDDGSNDTSGQICDEYAKTDIRIKAYHQDNQGHTMARRNAIAKAAGEFCLFLDSDDYWDSDLLQTIDQTIRAFDCDIVIFNYQRVSEKGVLIAVAKPVFLDKAIFDQGNKQQLFQEMIGSSNLNKLVCKAVKRSIIDDANYTQYKNIRNGEDLLQSLPLLFHATKIVYIDKVMYNYRMVATSIIHTFNVDRLKDAVVVRSLLLQYLRALEMDNEDNLKQFYHFFIKGVVNYNDKLINTERTRKEKIEIFDQIQQMPFYNEALSYDDFSCADLKDKIFFILFNNRHYKLLIMYGRIVGIFRRIKNLLLKRREFGVDAK